MDTGYCVLGPALGAGTFGEVFPAIWKNGETEAGGQLVAIKHVRIGEPHKDITTNEAREVEIVRALQHPNVVKLLHVARTPLALDLVFEHCKFDLRAALKGSVDIGTAASCIRQLCAGMAFVHGNHIIHKDFKPANVCFGKNNMARPLCSRSEILDAL